MESKTSETFWLSLTNIHGGAAMLRNDLIRGAVEVQEQKHGDMVVPKRTVLHLKDGDKASVLELPRDIVTAITDPENSDLVVASP